MSFKNRIGQWVIPQDQVNEFMTKNINYRSLFTECITSMGKNKIKIIKGNINTTSKYINKRYR